MTETPIGIEPEAAPPAGHLRASVDEGRTSIAQSAIGLVRGDEIQVGQALVGAVVATGSARIEKSVTRTVLATGNVSLQQGGGAMILVGGDADIQQGGTGTMVALGGARFAQGGAVTAIAPRIEVTEGSTVGIALTPRLELAPGARVLAGPQHVLAGGLLAGAVAGLIVALLGWLRRR
jgi:hypothetical protein